ncbi:MAG: hypothetical protein CMO30_09685 [Tistrella sp.]|nr:hypothetical protein [Tistrella sp.]MBA75534.1 hypothetical protein [Tistrella sp.]
MSAPRPPRSTSSPSPPMSVLAPSSPVRLSLPLPPVRFSMLLKLSPSGAVPVARLATTVVVRSP